MLLLFLLQQVSSQQEFASYTDYNKATELNICCMRQTHLAMVCFFVEARDRYQILLLILRDFK